MSSADPPFPSGPHPAPSDPVSVEGSAPHPGDGLVNASFAGTGALVAAGLAGVASPDRLGVVTAVVAGVLFVVGVGAFLWAYAVGVARSRQERITLGGLFWLSGTAPKLVRLRLRLAFAVQVVAAVVCASIRPYTAVAFVVLGPMFGLGLLSRWAARYGTFFPKDGGPGPAPRDHPDASV